VGFYLGARADRLRCPTPGIVARTLSLGEERIVGSTSMFILLDSRLSLSALHKKQKRVLAVVERQ
jgi:hypothetical protein